MKHYTSEEQTARLIELGFEKPTIIKDYTIGELINVIPPHMGERDLTIYYDWHFVRWIVCADPEIAVGVATELTDALFNCIVILKEKGVI